MLERNRHLKWCVSQVFLALGASEVDSALFCFVLSVVFLLTAFVAYMGATRSQFYQHYLGEKVMC